MAKRRKGVTPTFKELLADLKPMTFGQKLDHLWSYYKEYLLVVFLIGVVICIAISSYINANKEYLFKGIMANISMSQEGYTYLTDGLLESMGDGSKNQTVLFDYTNFTSLADPTSGEDNYAATMVLISRVSAAQMDCALLDQLAFEFYMTQGLFSDLRVYFTQEQLDAMGADVIYIVEKEDLLDEETGEVYEDPNPVRWPIAIEVSNMPFFEKHAPDNDKVYLVISKNQPDLKAVAGLWEHIVAWKE